MTSDRLYRSTDEGKTWSRNDFKGWGIRGMAAAADRRTLALILDTGKVFISTDAGANWSPTPKRVPNVGNRTILITDRGAFISYSLGESASSTVYRSTDQGATWSNVYKPGFSDGQLYQFGSTIMLATLGIHVSTDDGVTWRSVGIRAGTKPARDHDGVINVLGLRHDSVAYRSTDNGLTWESKKSRVPYTYGHDPLISLSDGSHIIVQFSQIRRSTDGCVTWSDYSYLPSSKTSALLMPESIVVGAETGVVRSLDNGATWLESTDTIDYPKHLDIVVAGNGNIVVGGTVEGIQTSTDGGQTWRRFLDRVITDSLGSSSESRHVSSLAAGVTGTLHAASELGLFRSTDYGMTWSRSYTADMAMVVPGDSGVVIATYSSTQRRQYLRSINDGQTWDTVTLDGYWIRDAFFNQFDHRYYFALHRVGLDTTLHGYYRMRDSVTPDSTPIYGGNFDFTQVYHDRYTGRLFRRSGRSNADYLYVSLDTGHTWKRIGTFTDRVFQSFLALPGGVYLLPSSNGKLLRLTGQDSTYSTTDVTSTEFPFTKLALDSTGRLLGITERDGIHRTLQSIVQLSDVAPIPSRRSTMKVSPNPCRDHVVVELPTDLHDGASVMVTDILGRTMRTYTYSPAWEVGTIRLPLDDLPAGYYRVGLSDGTHSATIVVEK